MKPTTQPRQTNGLWAKVRAVGWLGRAKTATQRCAAKTIRSTGNIPDGSRKQQHHQCATIRHSKVFAIKQVRPASPERDRPQPNHQHHDKASKDEREVSDKKLRPMERQILRLYATGITQVKVAEELGVSQPYVSRTISANQEHLDKLMDAMDKVALEQSLLVTVLRLKS